MAAPDVGDSASITLASFVGNIISMEVEAESYEIVPTSHLGTTTAKTFMRGDLYDPGLITLTIQHDPNEQPPANGTLTITYPLASGDTTAATAASSVELQSYNPGSVALDEVMTGTVVYKRTGAITYTDSAA